MYIIHSVVGIVCGAPAHRASGRPVGGFPPTKAAQHVTLVTATALYRHYTGI